MAQARTICSGVLGAPALCTGSTPGIQLPRWGLLPSKGTRPDKASGTQTSSPARPGSRGQGPVAQAHGREARLTLSHHQQSHIGEHLWGTSCPTGHRSPLSSHPRWTMAAQGARSTPGSREARVQPSPGQAGCRSPTYTQLDSQPRTLRQGHPRGPDSSLLLLAVCPRVAPGSTAGSGATRPRPLAHRVASGTVVVVPAALSLPGYHTTTVHAKGSPRQLVALRREATSQQQRPGGEATKRSLAWDPPSLSRLPKNRERREVPGLLRPPGVPNPFLAESSEAELPQSPPRPYHLDVKISAMSLNDSPHPGAYPGILQMATTGQTGHISHGHMTEDPAPRAPQFLEPPRPCWGKIPELPAMGMRPPGHCLSLHCPLPAWGHRKGRKCSKPTWRRQRGRDSQTGQGQGRDHTQGVESGLSVNLSTASQDSGGQPRIESCRGQSTCQAAEQECCAHIIQPEPP